MSKKLNARTFIKFFFRSLRLRLVLTPIDRKSPFKGKLAETGVYSTSVPEEILQQLKKKFADSFGTGPLVFDENDQEIVSYISDELHEIVRDYLGQNSYLDGFKWIVTDPQHESVSGNWHTDNVGNRIRVFICVEGDGSQPTMVVPSKNRVPSFLEWLANSYNESIRWLGRQNHSDFEDSVECKHSEGTIYLFDTQLFHRGGYESGGQRRVILNVDFSNPDKHKIARGPIGTEKGNKFQFHKNLLKIESFSSLLDLNRYDGQESGLIKYNQSN